MPDVRQATVLVVDDEPALRRLISAAVGRVGMVAIAAADGQDALAVLAARGTVDAAIVDLKMPNMDGVAFCKALRSDARYARLPVVMISGAPDLKMRAADAGASAILAKPFSGSALVAQLRKILPCTDDGD